MAFIGNNIKKIKTAITDNCGVRFLLSTTSSDNLLVEEKVPRFIRKWCHRNQTLTAEMLSRCLSDMLRTCLIHRTDSHEIHRKRLKGISLINKIAKRGNYSDMGVAQIVALVWSCLSVVHHFHLRCVASRNFAKQYRRRQYHNAMTAYERVLAMLLPQLFHTVVKSLIVFCNEARLWSMETYVTECLKQILFICKQSDGIINHLLDIVDISKTTDDARDVLKIIQNLFQHMGWKHMDEYILQRILTLYRRSTMNEEFISLRYNLEACICFGFQCMDRGEVIKVICTMLEWLEAITPSPIYFGKVLEYAAGINNREPYEINLKLELMELVLNLITSPHIFFSLLGCRVLFLLLDRRKNGNELLVPKIFFMEGDYKVTFSQYDERDMHFCKKINNLLQSSLLTALIQHGSNRKCTEIVFGIMATLVVEIPCSYTAAVAVSFSMAAQDYVLAAPDDLEETGYQIHASVIFIMTLVCYVHNAKTMYTYISTVIEFRAKHAPQFNPPLFDSYTQHPQVLGRKELYVEDWDVRYGLQKCFLLDETDAKKSKAKKFSKMSDRSLLI